MLKFVLVVALIVLLLGLVPFLTILSMNVLFGLGIPITFKTWMACFWLQLLITAKASK
jgi:hypothetical protein